MTVDKIEVKKLTEKFQRLLDDCPEEANARQKIIEEKKNGHRFVTVVTTFKIDENHSS
jgi:hypothetical protein